VFFFYASGGASLVCCVVMCGGRAVFWLAGWDIYTGDALWHRHGRVLFFLVSSPPVER